MQPVFPSRRAGPPGPRIVTATLMGGLVRFEQQYDDNCGWSSNACGYIPVKEIGSILMSERPKGSLHWTIPLQGFHYSPSFPGESPRTSGALPIELQQRDDLVRMLDQHDAGFQVFYVGRFGPRTCVNAFGEMRFDHGTGENFEQRWPSVRATSRHGALLANYDVQKTTIDMRGNVVEQDCVNLSADLSYEPWEQLITFDEDIAPPLHDLPTGASRNMLRKLSETTGAYMDELLEIFRAGLNPAPSCGFSHRGRYRGCTIVRPQPNDMALTITFLGTDLLATKTVTRVEMLELFPKLTQAARARKGVELLDGVLLELPDVLRFLNFLFG